WCFRRPSEFTDLPRGCEWIVAAIAQDLDALAISKTIDVSQDDSGVGDGKAVGAGQPVEFVRDQRSRLWPVVLNELAQVVVHAAILITHCQYDAEARFAAHHAIVGLRGALEWKEFGHRLDAGSQAKGERIL